MTFETKFRNFVGRLNNKEFSHEELKIVSRELLNEYNAERKVIIEGWKGKSSFAFEEVGDNIIVTKYQKPERGAEPKEVKTIISLTELRAVQKTIRFALQRCRNIPFVKSTTIAELVYRCSWKEIFNNRKRHNKFTIILNVLEKKGVIEYRGGRIRPVENG